MSIITDALKKAEEERLRKAKQTLEEVPKDRAFKAAMEAEEFASEGLAAQKKSSDAKGFGPFLSEKALSFWLRFAFSIAVFLISVLVLYVVLVPLGVGKSIAHVWNSMRKLQVSQPVSVKFPKVPEPIAKESSADQEAQTAYVLSGISVFGKERYAFINNQIVKEGDLVDGAMVREVLDREVILETKAGEIKIRIPF